LKLVAEIKDEDLLFKLMHSLGSTFFKPIANGETEVVYFSGEKFAHYKGKLSKEKESILEKTAWKVSEIIINEVEDKVTIKQ